MCVCMRERERESRAEQRLKESRERCCVGGWEAYLVADALVAKPALCVSVDDNRSFPLFR